MISGGPRSRRRGGGPIRGGGLIAQSAGQAVHYDPPAVALATHVRLSGSTNVGAQPGRQLGRPARVANGIILFRALQANRSSPFGLTLLTTTTIFRLSRGAATAAVVLIVFAMFLYPGGTLRDSHTIGYSFSQNFLSDLGMTVTHGTQSNRLGARIFTASFGLLARSRAAHDGRPQALSERGRGRFRGGHRLTPFS